MILLTTVLHMSMTEQEQIVTWLDRYFLRKLYIFLQDDLD